MSEFEVTESWLRESLLPRVVTAARAAGADATAWVFRKQAGPLWTLEHPREGAAPSPIGKWSTLADARTGMETLIAAYDTIAQPVQNPKETFPPPSAPYTVAYDDRDPESPWVAQRTTELGRFAVLRDARRANMLDSNKRCSPDFPAWEDVAKPYATAADRDRFVVTLIAGFDPRGSAFEITTPAEAAKAALRLTRGQESRSTVWHVFDRRTSTVSTFDQSEFEHDA